MVDESQSPEGSPADFHPEHGFAVGPVAGMGLNPPKGLLPISTR